jgi:hypothetical protein
VVFLDCLTNRILPDGTPVLDRPLFGPRVWGLLADVTSHPGVNWVVLASPTPLVHADAVTVPFEGHEAGVDIPLCVPDAFAVYAGAHLAWFVCALVVFCGVSEATVR